MRQIIISILLRTNDYMIRNFTLATTRIYLVVQVKPNSPVRQLSGSIPEAGPHAKQRQ